jgi:hypothetical protein
MDQQGGQTAAQAQFLQNMAAGTGPMGNATPQSSPSNSGFPFQINQFSPQLGTINQPPMPFLGGPMGQQLDIQGSAQAPTLAPAAPPPDLPPQVTSLLNPQPNQDYMGNSRDFADGGSVPRNSRDVILNALRLLYPRG